METIMDALKIQCSEQISPETKAGFKALLENILDHSPSDSTAEGEISADADGGINAVVHIRSQAVDFKTEKAGKADLILKTIRGEIFRQIHQWRDHRPDAVVTAS